MNKNYIYTKIIAITGATAVFLGAFSTHYLSNKLTVEELTIFKTANQYHFIHLLAICFMYVLIYLQDLKIAKTILLIFTLGIIFFSGSLYIIACKNVLHITPNKLFYLITPLGGAIFILGWIMCFKLKMVKNA
ncbi:MAG: DUF423 domain-containing protein [Sediminibacterium sp.]|nr:DUF423 domain-containing protein [Sediminibacterium sp.]